jgi:NADH-quinone oxidoreductase subunit H
VLFFLAEYSNILIMSTLIVLFFLGGWNPILNLSLLYYIPLWIWLSIKICIIVFLFIIIRGTLPRYRYDQLMNIGWKVLLPLSLSYFFVVATIFWIL